LWVLVFSLSAHNTFTLTLVCTTMVWSNGEKEEVRLAS
jgi:hypothetical protein